MTDAPMLPLLVGVTGHRDICPSSLPLVRRRAREIFENLISLYGASQLHVLIGMAEGADLEMAELAAELGLARVQLFPTTIEQHHKTVAQPALDRYAALQKQHPALLEIVLPPVASALDNQTQDIVQYEQQAVFLARTSHILLALWDGVDPDPKEKRQGAPRSQLRGGTAHVLGIRRHGEYAEVARESIKESALFANRLPRLELARCGPILHILTPRARSSSDLRADAGTVRWWSDSHGSGMASAHEHVGVWETLAAGGDTASGLSGIAGRMPVEFSLMKDAEALLQTCRSEHGASCDATQVGLVRNNPKDRKPAVLEVAEDSPLQPVMRLFGAADTISWSHQQALLGDWAPGLPWRRRKGLRRLGALFWFATALPLMSACFEIYCEYGKDFRWLFLYLTILAVTAGVYWCRVRKNHWQNRYQDYRALAEAVRVQFYWSASGVPLSASDNYLRQHEGELGWIRFALRGAALRGTAHALRLNQPSYGAVTQLWMREQEMYFTAALLRYKRADTILKRCTTVTLAALIASVSALMIVQMLNGGRLPESWGEILEELPSVVIGVLPGIMAFFVAFQELRLFEEHAHVYEQSARVCDRAAHQAEDILRNQQPETTKRREWRSLAVALGKESLAENASWIQLHRSHPIVPKAGG